MRGFLMMAAALLAGAGCVAQDKQACDELAAVPGFELDIAEVPRLMDATYTWKITTDGVTRTRDVVLKNGYGTCDCAEAGIADAPDLSNIAITMQDGGAQLTLLDDPNGTRRAGPSHIELTMSRGPEWYVSFTFDPTYRPVSDECQSVMRAAYDANVVGP